ncbi:hypothetical protein HOP51_02135 [Halomonas sp. MCCC 1A11036]|uniref:Uncharacterized protein n=1 Tax=Billgrantia zhangzhouensis TaxID=2733481 RepID=A0ABS9AAG8_9GAMM|nr:hypothetical protein [Halomonas zhangzhouensis]MCE8018921.1 hypothetical protein [Halomonas zhangzhouensis]
MSKITANILLQCTAEEIYADVKAGYLSPQILFRDAREVIRPKFDSHDDVLEKFLSDSFSLLDNCVETKEIKKLIIEVSVLVNAGLYGKSVCLDNILKIDNFLRKEERCSSSCFSGGVISYVLGDYKTAEKKFMEFDCIKPEKILYHQTAAPAFRDRSYCPQPRSTDSAGEIKWCKKAEPKNITVLVSCDIGYFVAYGKNYIDTIKKYNSDLNVHFHIINPIEDIVSQADFLTQTWIGYSTEKVDYGNVKTYSSLARYIIAPSVIERYGNSVFISDIDLLVEKNPHFLSSSCRNLIGLYIGRKKARYFPWTAIKAGAGFYPNEQKSIAFLKTVGDFMLDMYSAGNDGWMLDQVALEFSFRLHSNLEYLDLKNLDYPIGQVKNRGGMRRIASDVIRNGL